MSLNVPSKIESSLKLLLECTKLEAQFRKDKRSNRVDARCLAAFKRNLTDLESQMNKILPRKELNSNNVDSNLLTAQATLLEKINHLQSKIEKWNKKLGINSLQSKNEQSPFKTIQIEMEDIAHLFATGKKSEAFSKLTPLTQKWPKLRGEIAGRHWAIIPKPTNDYVGYGEHAFFDEYNCTSSDDHKSQAILDCIDTVKQWVKEEAKEKSKQALVKVEIPSFVKSPDKQPSLAKEMQKIASKFKESKKDEALKETRELCKRYPKLRDFIGGEHWNVITPPTNPPWGYGEKAFFEEDNCSSSCQDKATALLSCVNHMETALSKAQALTAQLKLDWAAIDQKQCKGTQKYTDKIQSIHQCVRSLLQLLESGETCKHFQEDQQNSHSISALINAYTAKYPSLSPYLAQFGASSTVNRLTGCQPAIDSKDINAQKNYRKDVFLDTIAILKNGSYQTPSGNKKDLSKDIHEGKQGLLKYTSGGEKGKKEGKFETLLIADPRDCMELALLYKSIGCRVGMLDMANSKYPLGNPYTGARAQEEDIARRSTLAAILDPGYEHRNPDLYPFEDDVKIGKRGGIYLPNVKIFAKGYEQGYQYLENPESVAVIVSAAFNKPDLDLTDSQQPKIKDKKIREKTYERMRTQLRMAYENKLDTIILSAFGCGAFGNPPNEICNMYMEIIKKEYPNSFKYIVFSVMDDHNSSGNKPHNPQGNFKPFADMIKKNNGIVVKS